MLRDRETGAPVVDTYEVVVATFWEFVDVTVQQNEWNMRLIERPRDAEVHLVLSDAVFQRSKENSGDASFQIGLAKLLGLEFFRCSRMCKCPFTQGVDSLPKLSITVIAKCKYIFLYKRLGWAQEDTI